jgi:hypothetical protein
MAEYVELYIDQGADFSTTIDIDDDNTNLPVNVAGYVVTSQLKKSLLSQNSYANLSCIVNNIANEILIEMAAANTANLKPGRYFFDVKVKDSGNITSRLIEGTITVNPGITR